MSPRFCAGTTQIAFFGGSFTAIDRGYMRALLQAAKEMTNAYGLAGVRISTRPDKIDNEVLELLREYGVTAIELGAQSMDEAVLAANRRGHTAEAVKTTSRLIKQNGFELGHQMMTGLYLDTPQKAWHTAKELIALKPDTIRIYPTIVLPGTYLAELLQAGSYAPQTLDEAVDLAAKLMTLFEKKGVKVIRVGLHAEEELSAGRLAGPYHPAFKELCLSRILLGELLRELSQKLEKTGEIHYTVKVNVKTLSAAVGQKKANVQALQKHGFSVVFSVDNSIPAGCFALAE